MYYPMMFEYYSAIYMSHRYSIPFCVWSDIPSHIKQKSTFPIRDMGVDVANHTLCHVVQSKYYRNHHTIHYGKLATFLATPILTGKNMKMTLIRTDESRLDPYLTAIVQRGDIEDIQLYVDKFLEQVKIIEKKFD